MGIYCIDRKQRRSVICAVGSGKGGVGKSIITIKIGAQLAKLGKKVTLVDTDLGGGNLHTLLGIRGDTNNINDFLLKRVSSLKGILQKTEIKGLSILKGASDILTLANVKFAQKERLIRELYKLEADFVILDLGAGSSYNMLDLFILADLKILVFSPEPTSVENAYGFLNNALYRSCMRTFSQDSDILPLIESGINSLTDNDNLKKLLKQAEGIDRKKTLTIYNLINSFIVKAVLNMERSEKDKKFFYSLREMAEKINMDLGFLGAVPFDKSIVDSIKTSKAFYSDTEKVEVCISGLAHNLLRSIPKCPIYTKSSVAHG